MLSLSLRAVKLNTKHKPPVFVVRHIDCSLSIWKIFPDTIKTPPESVNYTVRDILNVVLRTAI